MCLLTGFESVFEIALATTICRRFRRKRQYGRGLRNMHVDLAHSARVGNFKLNNHSLNYFPCKKTLNSILIVELGLLWVLILLFIFITIYECFCFAHWARALSTGCLSNRRHLPHR